MGSVSGDFSLSDARELAKHAVWSVLSAALAACSVYVATGNSKMAWSAFTVPLASSAIKYLRLFASDTTTG
jgi:hypothetical protein